MQTGLYTSCNPFHALQAYDPSTKWARESDEDWYVYKIFLVKVSVAAFVFLFCPAFFGELMLMMFLGWPHLSVWKSYPFHPNSYLTVIITCRIHDCLLITSILETEYLSIGKKFSELGSRVNFCLSFSRRESFSNIFLWKSNNNNIIIIYICIVHVTWEDIHTHIYLSWHFMWGSCNAWPLSTSCW